MNLWISGGLVIILWGQGMDVVAHVSVKPSLFSFFAADWCFWWGVVPVHWDVLPPVTAQQRRDRRALGNFQRWAICEFLVVSNCVSQPKTEICTDTLMVLAIRCPVQYTLQIHQKSCPVSVFRRSTRSSGSTTPASKSSLGWEVEISPDQVSSGYSVS